MIILPQLKRYGYPGCIMVLPSCTLVAARCHLEFGADIIITTAQVAPYRLIDVCCDVCFC
jgi:hypothetical protein